MGENTDGAGPVARPGRTPRGAARSWRRRVLGGLLGLSCAGAFLIPEPGVAQGKQPAIPAKGPPVWDPNDWPNTPPSPRMALNPRAMATGTRTERAGLIDDRREDGVGWLYVPRQCVGTRRCPLLVVSSQPPPEWTIPVADKYGFLLSYGGTDEAMLKRLLQQFAIDPDKIALMGQSANMFVGMAQAAKNTHVYSRIALLVGGRPRTIPVVDPPNNTTEFYIESSFFDGAETAAARDLRRAGHRVKSVIGIHGHAETWDAFDGVGHWLTESWAIPDPAARPAPDTVAEVLLTTEAIAKMTTFWNSFMALSDRWEWIRTIARRDHQRDVALNPAKEDQDHTSVVVRMMDMPAMAAKFPTVARLLQAAGLTAQQHEEYRIAIFSAHRAWLRWQEHQEAVLTTSVLGQNVVFLETHPDVFQANSALERLENHKGMWHTP